LAKLTQDYHPNAVQTTTQDPSMLTERISTEPGLLMGTATYMSPEQARGLDVDAQTDIWSWGVVLYEMIAGEAPFQGATTSDLVAEILRGDPVLLSSDLPQLPGSLKRVIIRSLTKEREKRFATISEPLNHLRSLQKQLEIADFGFNNAATQSILTQSINHLGTGQSNVAERTDSHVVADNFRTIPIEELSRSVPETTSRKSRSRRLPITLLIVAAGVVLLAVVAIKQLVTRLASPPQLEFTRLSSEENVSEAVISPDGKYIASVIVEAGLNSLWIRQTNTSANLRLTGPTRKELAGLAFSHEGDTVYFLENKDGPWTLYSVSVLGGEPRKLTENLETPVTFSPDGRRMAFVRPGANDSTVLTLANSDGTQETSLIELKGPGQFVMDLMNSTGPAWSPDGKVIAVPTIDEKESSREDVVAVQVADGTMRRINQNQGFFARVRRLLWLPDGLTLIMTANIQHTAPYQIWTLSYRNGEPENITNDADDYVGLSVTRDGQTFLSTRISIISSLWTIDRASQLRQIPSTNHNGTNGISWTSDGQIVYARNVAGSCDLWVMNADGTSRKQLTFDGQRNLAPTLSPDGRYLVFVSYREGRPHLWRVSADGTGLRQLTNGTYEDMPIISPDSKWVIYRRRNPSGLWKVSLDGGEPLPLKTDVAYFPAFSPDGQHLAFVRASEKPNSSWRIAVTSPPDGSETIDLDTHPAYVFSPPGLRWTADSAKITYVVSVNGVANIWGQPISGGPVEQLTNFTEGKIFYYAWSNDGQLACARGNSTKELLLLRRPP
jgi:eukaryotic-like serine/threonine-protein kinase